VNFHEKERLQARSSHAQAAIGCSLDGDSERDAAPQAADPSQQDAVSEIPSTDSSDIEATEGHEQPLSQPRKQRQPRPPSPEQLEAQPTQLELEVQRTQLDPGFYSQIYTPLLKKHRLTAGALIPPVPQTTPSRRIRVQPDGALLQTLHHNPAAARYCGAAAPASPLGVQGSLRRCSTRCMMMQTLSHPVRAQRL
jgi:hypothetical protein